MSSTPVTILDDDLQVVPRAPVFSIAMNWRNASFPGNLVWNKHMGPDLPDTKRKTVIPLIIGVPVAALIIPFSLPETAFPNKST